MMNNKVSMGANLKYTISPKQDAMDISIEQTFNGEIIKYHKEIINLKDKALHEALVSLGWTPPDKSKQLSNVVCDCIEALEIVEDYIVSSKWNWHKDDDIMILENALNSAREAVWGLNREEVE